MSRSKIAVIIVATVVVCIAIVVIGLKAGGSGDDQPSAPQRVRLEIRSNRDATIIMDGKKVGVTPVSVFVTRSTQPVTLEAHIIEHWMGGRGKPMNPERVMTKQIVPDHDQLIDFVPPPGPPPMQREDE